MVVIIIIVGTLANFISTIAFSHRLTVVVGLPVLLFPTTPVLPHPVALKSAIPTTLPHSALRKANKPTPLRETQASPWK